MKKMTLPVAVFIGILGCVLAVSANVTTMQRDDQLKQERYARMKAESELQKTVGQLNSLQQKVAETSADLNKIKQIVDKRDSEEVDLRAQLIQLSEEREALVRQVEEMKLHGTPSIETAEPSLSGETASQ